jgi:hypothetical protein
VLLTPTKLKTFTGLHSSGLVHSFETVISNMMGWDTITEIQGFFIYGAVGVPGIINDNLID